MNIAILGYGKMGCEIEKAAKARNIRSIKIDPSESEADYKEINKESMKNIDVCLDFTQPGSVIENIEKAAKHGKNLVIGTTGWYDDIGKAKKIVEETGIGLIWSGNFSIGVNVYLKIIEAASKTMNKLQDYDVYVHELHHSQKADSPSGTAIMIGKTITASIERKKEIVTEKMNRKINPGELHISSTRSGRIPGTHIVGFDSAADTIEIKHTARNREGFALGTILAAQWIHGKKGFYSISDLMEEITNQ